MARSPKTYLNQQGLKPAELDKLLSKPTQAACLTTRKTEAAHQEESRDCEEIQQKLDCTYYIARQIQSHPWVIEPLKAALYFKTKLVEVVFRDVGSELAARIILCPIHCSKKESQARAEVFLGEVGHFKATITKQLPTKEKATALFAGALSALENRAKQFKSQGADGPTG